MKFKFSLVLTSIALAASVGAGLSLSKNKQTVEPVEAATYNQSVNDYYSGINWDQTGATLKTALFNKIKITTAGWSYDGLWEAYKATDVRPDGTHFWDIYADSTDYTLNDKRINASYKKEGDSINREHVIPQSSFNEAAPMKSDIHHVLPSDGYVNNRRSAYPHGIVTGSPTYTSNDGCKLGSGTGSTTVFEPMDNYKGDIARIYFYFVTCYQDKMSSNGFSAFDKSTYPSIKSAYLDVYLQWAKDDLVSEKEIIRNNAAYAGQGNRNPFIDCPYAVGAIWDSDHASDYGNKGEYTSGTGVSISKTSASLISGGTTTISATSTDSSNITWTTSSSNVVSLSSSSSSSGNSITLTAGSAGTATITAKATISGTNYSKTCTVTVSATKQVASIAISGQKTTYNVDDTFVKPTVVATYNDDTQATVTDDATCTGYNMSTAGNYTVTVSYSYGGATKTTTYEISVSTSGGGSGNIDDYTISTSPLTSSGISNGMLVVWGTSTSNLATSISSNWVYLSTTSSSWLIFTLEGTSSGFKLKNGSNYVYCSSAKNVAFSSTNYITFTLRSDNLVTNNTCGTFYFNGTGLRPYASGSYTDAYLYALSPNKTLTDIDVFTVPKTSYEVGDTFDPTGLVIERTYSDNSTDTYAYAGHTSEFSFDPSLSTPLSADDEVVEITHGGQSCYLPIEVSLPKELSSISISGYTTSFTEGDTFAFGGTVTANYADTTSEDVTSSATVSGYDMATVGNQTVTVSYSGESETYQIVVNAGTLSSIAVSGQTTSYVKNAAFSFDGTCTATFANGYQKVVTPTSVSSPNMSTTGNKTVTVSYTYNGSTESVQYIISVNSYRTVMEASEVEGTITWSSSEATISGSVTGLSASTSGRTQYETSSMRLGTGSGGGTLSISSSLSITKIKVSAKYYNSYSSSVLKVDGQSLSSLTSNYKDYTVTLSSAKTSLSILTESSTSRVNIQSVTVYANGPETDIGQTEDCVGLESFINIYMHMDYVENLGYCNDSEHHYYSTAKDAFNALNTHQRSLFTGNSAYSAEWSRLSTWAEKNGDSLNSDNILEVNPNVSPYISPDNSSATLIIVIVVLTSISSICVLLIIKKRKTIH